MKPKPTIILIALTCATAGVLLGAASTLLLRVAAAAPPESAVPTADSLVQQILFSPDLAPVRRFVQDDPTQINQHEHGMLPLLAAASVWPEDTGLITYLLDAGADPTLVSNEAVPTRRHSAISYAAWMGDADLLTIYLERVRNPSASFADPSQIRRARAIVTLEHPHHTHLFTWVEE